MTNNRPHILILEDDPSISMIYQMAFGDLAEITHCVSGLKGQELFMKNPERYSLIITDDNMPDKNGMDVLEAICHYEMPLRLMVSSPQTLNAQETHAKVRTYNGIGLVKKPMEIIMLMKTVEELLKYKRSLTLEDYFRSNYGDLN